MNILFEGAKEFGLIDYQKNKDLYKRLSKGQKPHTLFICCSDSRVVPGLITKTLPGELFVVRNVANMVPFYRISTEFLATTSAIEYSVLVLNVSNIVVCGHSNCGGCHALLLDEKKLSSTPHTKRWLELASRTRKKGLEMVESRAMERDEIERRIEQENVIEQMGRLMTYPYIEEKQSNGLLNIYGWYFEIGSGTIYNYNKHKKAFEKIS